MITEFEIFEFMNHPKLLKLSFEYDYMMSIGVHADFNKIRYITPHQLGFNIQYCYSQITRTYKHFMVSPNDELYDFILQYFVEHKLSK